MISLIIIFTLFIILLGAAAYIVYITLKMKKERETMNNKLCLNIYKIDDEKLILIRDNIQDLLQLSQKAACDILYQMDIHSMVESKKEEISNIFKEGMKCSDVKTELKSLDVGIPSSKVEKKLYEIFDQLIGMSCTDDEFDLEKFKLLCDKLFKMFCPKD